MTRTSDAITSSATPSPSGSRRTARSSSTAARIIRPPPVADQIAVVVYVSRSSGSSHATPNATPHKSRLRHVTPRASSAQNVAVSPANATAYRYPEYQLRRVVIPYSPRSTQPTATCVNTRCSLRSPENSPDAIRIIEMSSLVSKIGSNHASTTAIEPAASSAATTAGRARSRSATPRIRATTACTAGTG